VPRLLLLNKSDLVDIAGLPPLDLNFSPARTFVVSAITQTGIDKLLNFLTDYVDKETRGLQRNQAYYNGETGNSDR
jgi:50S ribosomal subunit-associated GTPase HflX